METMLAGRLNYDTLEFSVKEIPLPTPGPGQVRIRVRAAGVCLSDLHLIDGSIKPPDRGIKTPREVTLGHEVSGEIELIGPDVPESWSVGDRVTLLGGQRCGVCDYCKKFELCLTRITRGVNYDGGWAEYAIADHFTMIAIPDDLPFEQAAIIPDAVSTPWAAVLQTAAVKGCESVGVWGVGGLGVHGVQLLRLVGAAPIVAVDPSPAARQRALEFGADAAFDSADPDLKSKIREITDGRMLDAAFDFAGFAAVRIQASQMLRQKGRMILVGIAPGSVEIPNGVDFAVRQEQVRGHFGSDPIHVKQLIELARMKRLDLSRSVSETMPLIDAAKAVHKVKTKDGDPIRIVLQP